MDKIVCFVIQIMYRTCPPLITNHQFENLNINIKGGIKGGL
jgi:hypothetical protein